MKTFIDVYAIVCMCIVPILAFLVVLFLWVHKKVKEENEIQYQRDREYMEARASKYDHWQKG